MSDLTAGASTLPLAALDAVRADPDVGLGGAGAHHSSRWPRCAAVAEADAVVFNTPEYAGTLPGSFKNLLDWLVGGMEIHGKRAGG